MTHRLSRTTALVAIALLACATLFFVSPGAALQTAKAAGTGGAGAVIGALAAARGTDYGNLALMGNAATVE